MGRRKDVSWTVPEESVNVEQAQLAVLMDIRDELKQLNRTMSCSNLTGIPHTLNRIREAVVQTNKRLALKFKLKAKP